MGSRARMLLLVNLLLSGCMVGDEGSEPAPSVAGQVGRLVAEDFVGTHVLKGITADGQLDAPVWPQSGVGNLRLWDSTVDWCDIEPAYGQFDWTRLDAYVQEAESRGYDKIVLVLGMPPEWATRPGAPDHADAAPWLCPKQPRNGRYVNPPAPEAWQHYVSAVTTRYQGRISTYQVWNEPASQMFYAADQPMSVLAELTRQARDIVSAIDPSAAVISAPLTPISGWPRCLEYLSALAAAGWPVDALAFHSYTKVGTVEQMLDQHAAQIAKVQDAIDAAKAPPLRLWETEIGHAYDFAAPYDTTLGATEQVRLVSRTVLDDIRYGIARQFWYAWDYNVAGQFGFGVILHNGNAASRALATMSTWVGGRVYYGCQSKKVGDARVTTCTFDKRKVMWADRNAKVPLARGEQYCTLPDNTCVTEAATAPVSPTPLLVK